MRRAAAILLVLLLLVCCFSLASVLQPRAVEWNRRSESGGVLKVMFGEGRRLFANHFFKEADVYFHSGYYPSIFDEAKTASSKHMTEADGDHAEGEEKCEMDFMRPPKDWVQAFGRRFTIHEHTHLKEGKEREILPWLRLSADLDPQRIDTYTVAAYWLQDLGHIKEAEQFLREGLQDNPKSYEILFELGLLYETKRNDLARAENLYSLALHRWQQREPAKKEPDVVSYEKIVFRLANVEEKNGELQEALEHYQMVLKVTHSPESVKQRIAEVRARLAGPGQRKP